MAAARGLAAVDGARRAEAAALLVTPSGELAAAAAKIIGGGLASEEACLVALAALQGDLGADTAAGHWKSACRAAFPRSDAFASEAVPGTESFEELVTFANAFEQLEIV